METSGLQYPKTKPEMLRDPLNRKWSSTVYRSPPTLPQVVFRQTLNPGCLRLSSLISPAASQNPAYQLSESSYSSIKAQFGPHLQLVSFFRVQTPSPHCLQSSIVMESQVLHHCLLRKGPAYRHPTTLASSTPTRQSWLPTGRRQELLPPGPETLQHSVPTQFCLQD